MPGPYGVVPTGFNAKTLEEHLKDIHDGCRAQISPIINLSSYTVLGQFCGIIASKARECTELAQAVYTSMDPASASDAALSNLMLITGSRRKDATFSKALCTLNLDAGTYPAGTLVAAVVGSPDSRFINVDEVVTLGGVVPNALFQAEVTGPVQALAGTLTVIAEPITGWNSVTNPTDAEEGQGIESDPAARLRREAEIAAAGSASDIALASAVSATDGVLSVSVFSNDTTVVDSNGLSPNSQEVVIFDGIVPGAANNDVAQAIWDNKTGGIPQIGSTSGIATDSAGVNHSVKFTRVAVRLVYLEIDISKLADGYVGDAAVKEAVVAWGDANLGIGRDVRVGAISAQVFKLSGVEDVTAIRLGFSALPVGTSNLGIAAREIADLDTSRIVINSNTVSYT